MDGKQIAKLKNVSDLAKEANIKILGKGSTGRTLPKNVVEEGAMKQVLKNPLEGKDLRDVLHMTDPRWLEGDGWVKMARNIDDVEIHWLKNTKSGEFDDFKFKN